MLWDNLVPVFGTETIIDNASFKKIFSTLDEAVLSIDKKNNVTWDWLQWIQY